MFGLSTREILVKVIKNSCVNVLPIYEQSVIGCLTKLNDNPYMSENQSSKILITAHRDYFNAVCDNVMNSLALSSPTIYTRFRIAMMEPQITGLPKEFSIDYLDENGISAGVVFGLAYFSMTERTVDTIKLSRTMSSLNHYQNNLMNTVLEKLDKM